MLHRSDSIRFCGRFQHYCWRGHRHERFLHVYALKRCLEVSDIDLEESRIILNRRRAHPSCGVYATGPS